MSPSRRPLRSLTATRRRRSPKKPKPAAGQPAAPGAALVAFVAVAEGAAFAGTRVKDLRHQELHPGGRASVTLFEAAEDDTRSHPRFRVSVPPATDPEPPTFDFSAIQHDSASAFSTWLDETLSIAAAGFVLSPNSPLPSGSPKHRALSVAVQRKDRFFLAVRAVVERLSAAQRQAGLRALRRAEDATYAGDIPFDDVDTGTYHSFQHDAPFVHYLEGLLASLPEEGSEAWRIQDATQQEALRRQRKQTQNHLDHLMRHKYANEGITETDIEKTLGGFLIDRETRHIVSEVPGSGDSLVPRYELNRIDPRSSHAEAGNYVYRYGDKLHLNRNHEEVEVKASELRSTTVEADNLSFRRAPDDEHLRSGIRFDWDGNGYVQPEPISWVSWAGHCDIKAIMEATGITLSDQPKVTEYRSDTDGTTLYDRDKLTEMVASVFELGSLYVRADGSGTVERGIHRFGGARNDSRPDRIQFQGRGGAGSSFRWPLGGRQDVFRVTRIQSAGKNLDLNTAFYRHIADTAGTDFAPNPLYMKTVEGDYSLLDVAGTLLEADILEDSFDPSSGYPRTTKKHVTIDLGANPTEERTYLGTSIKDPAARELYQVFLDRKKNEIEAKVLRYEKNGTEWTAKEQSQETVRLPLKSPMQVTLSREMKRDDPELFQALLQLPLREAQNICVDTDMKAEVWNGVVTRIRAERLKENLEKSVEHWRVDVTARFGSATLEYLFRRGPDGKPVGWAVAHGEDAWGKAPDFFWHDLPDVGSKALEEGDWVINSTMLERGIVGKRVLPSAQGGVYVDDEHVKNVFELIWCGLAGRSFTIVHQNKRYGFTEEAAWRAAKEELGRSRKAALAELPAPG